LWISLGISCGKPVDNIVDILWITSWATVDNFGVVDKFVDKLWIKNPGRLPVKFASVCVEVVAT